MYRISSAVLRQLYKSPFKQPPSGCPVCDTIIKNSMLSWDDRDLYRRCRIRPCILQQSCVNSKVPGVPFKSPAEDEEDDDEDELLEDKSYVDNRDEFGRTPLHNSRDERVTMMLIAAGADANSVDNKGGTPLHSSSDKRIAQILISAGADVNIRNKVGDTPLEHMKEKLSVEVPPELKERVLGIIKVLENPCAGVVHLLEEASKKISDLGSMISKLRVVVDDLRKENGVLRSERDTLKASKITPIQVKRDSGNWVCTNPYPKLSTDVQQRMNSCTPGTEGGSSDDTGDVYMDKISCMRSCYTR